MPPEPRVILGGLLGDALEASRHGRLARFIVDEHSPAIALFAPAHRDANVEGDWYGEHAGKWLIAAARAAARSSDEALAARVRRVTDHLLAQQQPDGYLGTYAPSRRFTVPQPPRPGEAGAAGLRSWDGAPALRTWDLWTHSYLILGLLEVHRRLAHAGALDAARRIGDLCWQVLVRDGVDVTTLGNHHGLSASVLIDPAMELHAATGDARYLELADTVLRQADAHPELALLRRALAGADAAEIATGKAYQLCWNLVGLAKLHRATRRPEHGRVLDAMWLSLRTHHLTPGGGPWGGVAHRSREVLNAPGSFSPQAYVETCSTLAWIQLNRQLLQATGEARYAEEIERSAYNDLLGAMAPNGEDWCYYSFANGRRVHTTAWRCCKSSGAMALEELPLAAYGHAPEGGLRVNLLGPGAATLRTRSGAVVGLRQRTAYPFSGDVVLSVSVDSPTPFELGVRVPAWAHGATLSVPGEAQPRAVEAGRHAIVERTWHTGEALRLSLPMPPRLRRHVLRNVQESRAPDGSPVRQEVLHHAHVAVLRGPLVYATGLIDGFKTEETVRLRGDAPDAALQVLPHEPGEPARVRLSPADRAPLDFVPYYLADGRRDGGWRLTWLSLAPEPAPGDAA